MHVCLGTMAGGINCSGHDVMPKARRPPLEIVCGDATLQLMTYLVKWLINNAKPRSFRVQSLSLMSFIDKIKAKLTTKKESRIRKTSKQDQPIADEQGKDEPTFRIQPHPAVSSFTVFQDE